jgi:signal transduction histidine kinase
MAMKRLGITGKLVVHSAWILIGLGVTITAYSVSQLRLLLYQEMVGRVEAQTSNWIEANMSQIILANSPEVLNRLVKDLKTREGIAYVILLGADGQQKTAIGTPAGLVAEQPPKDKSGSGPRWADMKDGRGFYYFELATRISTGTGMSTDLDTMFGLAASQATLGEIRVGVDRQEHNRRVGILVWRNVGLATVLVLLAVGASFVFAHRMVTPITMMGRASNQIAAGKLSERVNSGTQLRDEIGDLVRNFNQMAQRLQEDQEEMRLLYSGLEEKVRERTLELEQANRRLQELDQLKSKFLSTVSHELLTPLFSIKGSAQILQDKPDLDSEIRTTFSKTIYEESDRLSLLISDLLDLTKIESGTVTWRMSKADLPSIVRQSQTILAPYLEKKKIHLLVGELQPQVVWADADKVEQVITNLAGNSIKFCKEGGVVEIRLERSTTSGPQKTRSGEYARVVITDNGPGIPPEDRDRVFEPFFRGANASEHSGTGLGLAICREIVLNHKGEIWFDSEPGVGSKFFFTVPLHFPSGAETLEPPGKHVAGRVQRA